MRWCGVVVLGALCGPACGQTLTEALVRAYSTNPSLLAARANLRAVDETVPQALAGWRPTVIVAANAGYQQGDVRTRAPLASGGGMSVYSKADYPSAEMGVTLTQPLYRGGRTVAETRRARNDVYAQRALLLDSEQRVLLAVVQAYVEVLRTERVVALSLVQEQALARQAEMVRARMEIGANSLTDVAQAQARLAGAQASRVAAEAVQRASRVTFAQVVGAPPVQLSAPGPLEAKLRSREEAGQLAARNLPLVIAAQFQEGSARDAVDVARSALAPAVSVQMTGFRQDNQVGRGVRDSGGRGIVSLTVPLYQGGAEYSAIQQAREVVEQTRQTVDVQRRRAIDGAAQAWEQLASARGQLGALEDQVRSAGLALDGVRREQALGLRTVVETLNAQQELTAAQVQKTQGLADVVERSYALAAAVGQLTARDLGLPVALYDERANLREARSRIMGIPGTGGDTGRGRGSRP